MYKLQVGSFTYADVHLTPLSISNGGHKYYAIHQKDSRNKCLTFGNGDGAAAAWKAGDTDDGDCLCGTKNPKSFWPWVNKYAMPPYQTIHYLCTLVHRACASPQCMRCICRLYSNLAIQPHAWP